MVEQVVGLEFIVKGEREATQALKDFAKAGGKVGTSVVELGRKLSTIESEYRKINQLNKQGSIGYDAKQTAITKLSRQLAQLTGQTEEEAAASLKAAHAIEQRARAQRNLEGSILRQSQAVNQAVRRLDELNRLKESGAVGSRNMAQAEIEIARALARTNGYLKSNGALNTQKALAEMRAAQATRDAAAKAQEAIRTAQLEEAERIKLETVYNRTAAAARVYERAVENLNRAEQLGVISAAQKAAEMERLNVSYAQVGRSTANANTFINQFGDGVRVAGIKTNRFGLYAQQVGYQVGDFFVQIQSGTNAFVAFGQQATQLAGLLPGVAGAIVGIGISITTAFLSAWSRASDALDDTAESIKNLEGELKSLDDTIQEWLRTKKAASLGVTVEELFGIEGIEQAEKAVADAKAELDRLIASYGADIGPIEIEALTEIAGYTEAVRKLKEAETRLTQLQAKRREEETAKALEKQLELEKDISEAAAERNKEFADRKISLENEIRILRLTLRYGEDSVQVQKELNLQARARLITEMMADGQSADRIVAMLKLLKIHQELTAEVDKMKDSTDDLLDIVEQITGVDLKKAFYDAATSVSTMNSRLDLTMTKIQGILGAIGSIGFETVATEAQTRALREGKSVAQSRIEGQIAQRRAELEQSGEIGPLAGAALTAYRKTLEADMRAQEELQRELSDPRRQAPPRRPFDIEYPEPDKAKGGAGGDIFLSMFPELQRAYEQAQKDAQAYNEEVQILDSALKAGKISQQEYNSYLSQAQEVYGQASTAALQYENALLQMANTTSQAMSDAMMSIVDGTKSAKDAFSDMARIIIKKAFEMAVINPILNAIFGGVSGYVAAPSFFGAPAAAAAKGMTFQGGNVVPFANGGVVGGPATFPMSGGRTGLMGEAGPEAIMPLKRGKDGKLGVQATGASVNQTLVFNISANGDESVKRIVQQQIPNIAQATKAAVVDAKRRGGSYGRAFA